MWTYDNKQFLKFCMVFFILGSALNLFLGLYVMNFYYIMNGILIGVVSAGIGRILFYSSGTGE